MNEELLVSLSCWVTASRNAPPRSVPLWPGDTPKILFTDGFCDPLSGLAGFGAVLVEVDMNTLQAFGGHVEEAIFNELRKQVGDDQIVGQAELLTVMAARQKWCDVLGARPGRRVINFIDNDAARYGLIKGTALQGHPLGSWRMHGGEKRPLVVSVRSRCEHL